MRLSEPWFGSNCVVAADSWFASIRTVELLALNGLYFLGDVKTDTRRSVPKDDLKRATSNENDAWATWTSTLSSSAATRRRGESIHGFVSSCGTSDFSPLSRLTLAATLASLDP